MADESYLLSLAVGARDDLDAIAGQLDGFKDFQATVLEFMAPDSVEVAAVPAPLVDSASSAISQGVPDGFFADLMAFEYAQTVTGVLILVVVAFSLGVQLFQSFAYLWRS